MSLSSLPAFSLHNFEILLWWVWWGVGTRGHWARGKQGSLKENVRRWVNKPCLNNSFIECGPHTQDSVTSRKPSRACWILLIALGNHWGYSAVNRGVFHKWVLFSVTLENLSYSFLRKRVGSVCGS